MIFLGFVILCRLMIIDFDCVDDIKKAIMTIDVSYQDYVDASKRLFNSVDNRAIISKALRDIVE